ncbi:MAG: ribose-phosphate pyrophosphokinase [Candidatus Omnitrophota bacterium]|nr:MAG: ribose-phosphate pyrophosphokinase [Candidatus Omnitrophota bacterium]
MFDKLAVFCGNANPKLAKDICKYLRLKLGQAEVTRFSEGEIRVKINENVRGKDVFLIQPTCSPPNENMMELLIMIDALKRASASRITAVLPYYGYARQDRKDQPRVPITAKLVADLITVAGASRLLTIDLHAGQIQGFFDIPVDHLYAINTFVEYFQKLRLQNLVVVSPDVGGIKMARAYAKRFNTNLAIIDKRRINTTQTEVMNIMGEVKGKNAIIIDDLVATAGSLVEATQALKNQGAEDIYAAITHPVLSGPALERIEKSALKHIAVCDTIPVEDGKIHPKIKVLTVAPLLGEAIKRIHNEESVSCLFD